MQKKRNRTEYMKIWRKNNRDKIIKSRIEWDRKNPEKVRAMKKRYRKVHPNSLKDWRKKNPGYDSMWRDNNRDKMSKAYHKHWKKTKNNPIRILKDSARGKANHKYSLKNKICEICRNAPAKHRHHPNYNNPLQIILCCLDCHRVLHNPALAEQIKGRQQKWKVENKWQLI